jgi:hypothetical protein
MGGKGPGSPSISQTFNRPWGPERPYLKEALGYLQQFLTGQGNRPLAPYNFPNQQVAPQTGAELAGVAGTTNLAGAENSAYSPALPLLSDTLSGTYLNPATNPWLTATYGAAAQPLTEAYQSSVAPSEMTGAIESGAFGGSSDAEARALNQYQFGGQLQNLATNLYGQNYQTERQNQLNLLSNLGGVSQGLNAPNEQLLGAGGFEQAQQQNVLNTQYQNAYNQAEFPYQLLGMFTGGAGVGGLGGGAGSSTTIGYPAYDSSGLSLGQGLLGGAGIGASLLPWLLL